MIKDQIIETEIIDITNEGAGVGKPNGYPLFIKDTVPGDIVLAKVIKDKKTYAYARVTEIIKPSDDRIMPCCPVAGPCGGCQIQCLSYETQLKFKRKQVSDVMTRIGGIDKEVMPVIGMENPWNYRNKAEYPVRNDKNGDIKIGFYAGHSHNIISCDDCKIGQKSDIPVLQAVKEWMRENGISAYNEETGKGLIRHILIRTSDAYGEIMVCIIINAKKLPAADELKEKIMMLSIPGKEITSLTYCINTENNNVIMGREVKLISGKTYITDKIGDVSYRISPQSFYQVNPEQTQKLYAKALEFAGLTGGENVWDLYCGIGTISLFLAQKAGKVRGVEIIPQAIEDAKENALLNGISNAEFFCGKAEDVLPEHYKKTGEKADVIVVDPPRKGCDANLLETMMKMEPDRIVYVSCNPATLARDLKILSEKYNVEKIQPVDLFPQTVHVETCVLLSRETY